jgi:hypothetical protein
MRMTRIQGQRWSPIVRSTGRLTACLVGFQREIPMLPDEGDGTIHDPDEIVLFEEGNIL